MIRLPQNMARLVSQQRFFNASKTYEVCEIVVREVAEPSAKLSVKVTRAGDASNFSSDADVKALLERQTEALERLSPTPDPNEIASIEQLSAGQRDPGTETPIGDSAMVHTPAPKAVVEDTSGEAKTFSRKRASREACRS